MDTRPGVAPDLNSFIARLYIRESNPVGPTQLFETPKEVVLWSQKTDEKQSGARGLSVVCRGEPMTGAGAGAGTPSDKALETGATASVAEASLAPADVFGEGVSSAWLIGLRTRAFVPHRDDQPVAVPSFSRRLSS